MPGRPLYGPNRCCGCETESSVEANGCGSSSSGGTMEEGQEERRPFSCRSPLTLPRSRLTRGGGIHAWQMSIGSHIFFARKANEKDPPEKFTRWHPNFTRVRQIRSVVGVSDRFCPGQNSPEAAADPAHTRNHQCPARPLPPSHQITTCESFRGLVTVPDQAMLPGTYICVF